MLSKLLSLLVAGKGGAVAAAAIVAGATTVSVMTTSTDFQDGMNNVVAAVQNVVGASQSADEDKDEDEDDDSKAKDRDCLHEGHGQPVVVAQRNAADKLVRIAFEEQHRRLEHARDGKDLDHSAANALLQKADRDLRAILTQALNDVAKDTLGREGQNKPSGTPTATPTFTITPTPTATPTFIAPTDGSPTATPKPTCSPKPSPTPTAAPTASPTPTATPTAGAAVRGREEVAARVTLDAKLQAIVDKAKADMKAVVDAALAALPTASPHATAEHGKPSASPEHGKNEEQHGQSGDHKPVFPLLSFSPRPGRP